MVPLSVIGSLPLLCLFHVYAAYSDCLEDEAAVINEPCKHYNYREDLYLLYKTKLERGLEYARPSHPVKMAWALSGEDVDVDSVPQPRVLNEIEARVLVSYGRATVQGFKMNDTDPLGDQLIEPLFYFLSKAYEKLQRYGKNTSDILFFVKSDKGGYGTCWPRWPTRLTQPEIAYKDRMRAMALSGDRGTIYQIKPLRAVDYGYYLKGALSKKPKPRPQPRYLLMPCTKYMVTERELKNKRKFVYLEEMDPNCAPTLGCYLTVISYALMLVMSHE